MRNSQTKYQDYNQNKRSVQSEISIEQGLFARQIDIRNIQNDKYIKNLHKQCQFQQHALKTAENLIQVYRRQNQQLKLENNKLIKQSIINQSKISQLINQRSELSQIQRQLINSTKKCNNFIQKNLQKDKIIVNLKKQVNELTEYKMKQWNKLQKLHVNNYFRNNVELLTPMKNQVNKNQFLFEENKRQVQKLNWKIRQKDQEIKIMLEKTRKIERKYQQMLHQVQKNSHLR